MNYEIVFANDDEEKQLREILTDCGMDLAGDIKEHVLIKKDKEIWGGGMVAQIATDMFHLLVFAVRKIDRNKGKGSRLLQELIGQPWRYCRDGARMADGDYRITTIAKGESAVFYEKNGFIRCDFSALAYPFDQQCDECPARSDCNPAAMMFKHRAGE